MTPSQLISVTILVKNGGAKFARCLETVYSQKTPFPFEVVVVDSGSSDGTRALYRRFPVRLFEIPSDQFQFGRTRDYAVEQARGEYVAILSQDAIPTDDQWLERLIAPLVADRTVAAVQGFCRAPTDEALFFWEKKGLLYYTRESQRWARQFDGIGFSNVNSAVRRDVWAELGFGTVPMSEDKAFQKKLVAGGHKIVRAPEALVYHAHTYDFLSLVKRCLNEGVGCRAIGWRYRWWECGLDLLSPTIWRRLRWGLSDREIRSFSEALFPLIRPIALFVGNHFLRNYVK